MKLKLENLSKKYSEVKPEDGLYLPNFDRNVFKLRDTFEGLLGVHDVNNSLLEYQDIHRIVEERDCLQPKNILHFTIDSLGLNQLIIKNNFFDEYRKNNEIIELSSLFPTITSTILPSIHSGLPPERHGILGHKIFFPEIGALVNTLIMNVANSEFKPKDSLIKSGVNPKSLLWEYRSPALFESDNYRQFNFLQFDIAMTGLSHLMIDSHSVIAFKNYIDALEKVRILLKRKEKVYIHFYIGDVDDISHVYGPFSNEYQKISSLLNYILNKFIQSIDPTIAKETLLTMTADHGQNSLYEDKKIPFEKEDLKKYGKFMYAPMGKSGRVLHFYVKEDKINILKDLLEEKIGNSGLILTKNDDLKPLFSTEINYNKLFKRLGNVIVIFKPNYSADLIRKKKEEVIEFKMQGTHGSLTKDELIVPLFVDKISNYKRFLSK